MHGRMISFFKIKEPKKCNHSGTQLLEFTFVPDSVKRNLRGMRLRQSALGFDSCGHCRLGLLS